MPWPSYSRWNREDLETVWEYLRSMLEAAARELDEETLMLTSAERVPGTGDADVWKDASTAQIRDIAAAIRMW